MVRVPHPHQLFYQYYLIPTYLNHACRWCFPTPLLRNPLTCLVLTVSRLVCIPRHFLLTGCCFLNFLGMPPGAAGYPPNSSYGGYPPPPHNRPDAGPYPGSGGGYPPSSYPPAQRPGWPPHQGYGPPPTNGGPPPPNNAPPPGADYRQGYYGPRPGGPGYPPGGPQSGPPQASAGASPATSTASSGGPPNAPGGPPPNQNLYGQQPPYHDQYQVCKN